MKYENIYDLKRFLFRKYDIEYKRIEKRLYIHKPIEVRDFIKVKELTKEYDIQNILVEPRSYIRL